MANNKNPLAGNVGNPLVRIPKFPQVRIARFPLVRIARFPLVRITRFPLVRIARFPLVRIARFPLVRIARFPLVRITRFPVVGLQGLRYWGGGNPLLSNFKMEHRVLPMYDVFKSASGLVLYKHEEFLSKSTANWYISLWLHAMKPGFSVSQ